jgi:hypothetical protein
MKYLILIIVTAIIAGCGDSQPQKVSGISFGKTETLTDSARGRFYKPRPGADPDLIFATGEADRGIWKINPVSREMVRLNGLQGAGTFILQPQTGGPVYFRVDTLGADRRRRFGIAEQDIGGDRIRYVIPPEYRLIASPRITEKGIMVFWNGKEFEGLDLNSGRMLGQDQLAGSGFAFKDSTIFRLANGSVTKINPVGRLRISGIRMYQGTETILAEVMPEGIFLLKDGQEVVSHIADGFQADWEPAAGLLAWVNQSDDGMRLSRSQITVGYAGGAVRQTLPEEEVEHPVWQPGGRYLIYNTLAGQVKRTQINVAYK